jgi:hypothetical protein
LGTKLLAIPGIKNKFAGDGMRIRSILLLLLVLLALPGRTTAQQDAAAGGKKAESKSDTKSETKSAPPMVKENWGVLDDLKTGLEPPTYSELESYEQPEFVRQLIRVQWRMTDPIDLWVIRPKVAGKVPVVLYLYSYLDAGEQFRNNGWCKRATADGFAAVGFVSALTDYRFRFRPLKQWFVSELAESLGTTVHDVQFTLNYLATREDMDMDHVGMFGMGSGASIAILAAHADPRIKTLDILDPWGDWPEWLKATPLIPDDERSKYLTPEFLKSVAALDPVSYLPSLKTRSLRLQQTLSEPETPKIAKERIAAAVPGPNELVQYADAQSLLKAWNITGLSGWIKQQMRPQTSQSGDDGRVAF